ncbi:MAG: hypothetical protein LUH10_00535 [Tannerellaceae bacterium]|nr:hypothetical protein [Tannerellaceae bacterium]
MKAKEALTEEQYNRLVPYDAVLVKLAENKYVNYTTEVYAHPILLGIYAEIYKSINNRTYVHPKTTCGSCSGSVAWAKRLGRYYINYKNKSNGK